MSASRRHRRDRPQRRRPSGGVPESLRGRRAARSSTSTRAPPTAAASARARPLRRRDRARSGASVLGRAGSQRRIRGIGRGRRRRCGSSSSSMAIARCCPAGSRRPSRRMDADAMRAVVVGPLQERHPEASVYNRLCALEWKSPAGDLTNFGALGGIMLVRADVFARLGGFNEQVIAGEDSEFGVRVGDGRASRCTKIGVAMATHDADIHRFSQWWRRGRARWPRHRPALQPARPRARCATARASGAASCSGAWRCRRRSSRWRRATAWPVAAARRRLRWCLGWRIVAIPSRPGRRVPPMHGSTRDSS